MRNKRLEPSIRRETILAAALEVAERRGYMQMTRDQIAEAAKCSTGLVTHYWSTMIQLRRAVMRYAVANGRVKIVAQGLGASDRYAKSASPALKEQALALLRA